MEMTMATDTKAYAALAQEAEAAVAAVKDPELRRVAFDKILGTLLEANSGAGSTVSKRAAKRQSGRAANRTVRSSTRSQTKGPKAYVEVLIEDGYFKKQRTIADVKAELANRGHHIALTSLSGPLQALTQQRRLRRQKASTDKKGAKTTYVYSNW
jgi:hypothetical protein